MCRKAVHFCKMYVLPYTKNVYSQNSEKLPDKNLKAKIWRKQTDGISDPILGASNSGLNASSLQVQLLNTVITSVCMLETTFLGQLTGLSFLAL